MERQVPEWLASAILNDTLKREKSIKTSIQYFLEKISLHDAVLLSACNNYDGTYLIFQTTSYWNFSFAYIEEEFEDRPTLILHFPNAASNYISNPHRYDIDIYDCVTETLSSAEIDSLIDIFLVSKLFSSELYLKLIDCDKLCKTKIRCHGEVSFEILHNAEINVYLIDSKTGYLTITLDDTNPFSDCNKSADDFF